MKRNNIGWCDKTVNPVTGCPNGCEYCYARSMNERFGWIKDFSKPEFFPERLRGFQTRKPQIIFIDSMSDIGCWEKEWFDETYRQAGLSNRNIYLALTKKLENAKTVKSAYDKTYIFPKPESFYIGATVTNNDQAQAVINAGGADFISFEPLLEEIRPELLYQLKCKWWIVGDLTKNGNPQGVTQFEWVYVMQDDAEDYGIPLFMKDSLKETMAACFAQQFPAEFIQKVGAR